MEDGSVKRLQRYISVLLCFAMLVTSVTAFSEGSPTTAEPALTAEPTEEPTAEPTAEPTPEPTAEPESTAESETAAEPDATDEVEGEPLPEPTVTFREDRLTYQLSEIGDDFDYANMFELTIENTDETALVWSTDDEEIAAFVQLDKSDMEAPDEETDEENIIVVFRAYQAGIVNVRAALEADEDVYGEFELTLEEDAPVYAASLSDETMKLYVGGETRQLTASLLENGTAVDDAVFAWASGDETVATVDETGLVTPHQKGTATITATAQYAGSTYEARCEVTVAVSLAGIGVAGIAFYSDSVGALAVTPEPADADFDPANLTFEIEAESAPYIQVSQGGEVSAVTQNGLLNTTETFVEAQVKVTYGGFTAVASVTVYQAATSITIEEDARVVWLGKTAMLGVTVLPENAHDSSVSYASSDGSMFTVDATGLIEGLALGTGTATVTMLSGRTVDFPVFVLQGTTSLRITGPSGNLRIGETVQLTLAREPADAVDELAWESSDESLATVDENGLVTLIAPGNVTITVLSESGASTSVGLGIIRPASGIALYSDAFPLFTGFILVPGQSVAPYVDVLPADATRKGYALSSSNELIAIAIDGRIYGVSNGMATITVTSEDGDAARTFLVKVVSKSKRIKSISVNRSSLSLKEGTKYTLRASVNSGAQSKTVLWGTLDPSVAVISSSGVVKAVAPGTTYIYAMSLSGVGKKIKVVVSAQLPTSVRLNKSSGSMYANQQYQFKATIYPSNVLQPQNRVITWQTSNKYVAVVSDTGMVYSIAPGTAYITARTVNGKTYRCKVTVKKRYVSSVKVQNPYGNLLIGGTYTLPATVLPANATDMRLSWSLASSSYKKYAAIDAKTGAIYCKKAGTIKVTATAKDGSRKRYTIALKIVSVPLTSFTMTRAEGDAVIAIENGAAIELAYQTSFTAVAAVEPALYLEWSSSDKRVATVANGLVTATGAGTATITATAGGRYTYAFTVTVPRDENQPTYRALVVAQYTTSGAKGYLPFAKNAQKGLYDALGESSVGGERYDLSYRTNLTSASQLTSAIESTFADAKEGDVSVLYLLSHGTFKDGNYVWLLYGSGSSAVYVSFSTIMSAVKSIKGHVVILIPSCYSGGDENDPSKLSYMVRTVDQAAGEGTSYSGIFASDGLVRASFFDTADTRSYDFFTYSLCKAMGWDYMKDSSISLAADKDGDGYVTLSELASTTKSLTADTFQEYFEIYGSSSYYGPQERYQNVTYYISPDAASLAIFGD